MRIVHADGTWLVNKCLFPMADPTQNVLLEPGEVTCVELSDWLKMQAAAGLFEQVQSPVAPLAQAPKASVTSIKKPT
jgi:hypothetical protein